MPDLDPIRPRPNCPHCGIPMSIVRRGVSGELVSYLCPWHGRFWLDEGDQLRPDPRQDENPQSAGE
jgi:nitrite reductase/ring-hydroxylating ferredoxin subunit